MAQCGHAGTCLFLCACVTCYFQYGACAGLGAVDAGRVRDLGLPSFDDSLLPDPAVEPCGSKKAGMHPELTGNKNADGPSGIVAQKFQLGPTLPVVPARIVRRVLRGDYVDMVELTEDNLELELRHSTDGEDEKSIPLSRLKPVPDALTWARLFCLYAGIVVSAHPSKARDLLAYLATLLAGAEKGDWWRAYDSRFRQQLPALELAEFGKLDQALFTRTFFSDGGTGHSQRSGPIPQVEGRNPQAAKRRKVAACFAWNDMKSCVVTPCRYSHVCSRCGGEHRKASCPPPSESSPAPASSS